MAFVRFLGKLGSPAIRISLSNKNVHQIASSRLFSSSPMLSAAVQKPSPAKTPPGGRKDALDTTFNDSHAAFKSKTTFELIRGYLVYLICSSETLVENNMKVRFEIEGFNGYWFCTRLIKSTRSKKLSSIKNSSRKSRLFTLLIEFFIDGENFIDFSFSFIHSHTTQEREKNFRDEHEKIPVSFENCHCMMNQSLSLCFVDCT